MHLRYAALLLLLLVSLSFADCAGYNDTFRVRVLDAKIRPIPGAAVTATYDRGVTGGEQYFTTPVRYTGQDGMLDFAIYNQATTAWEIDCDITIDVSIGGSNESLTVTANEHGSVVDVQLNDTYPLKMYVRDQSGIPLPDAAVTVDSLTAKTGADGAASYYFPAGNHSYMASYLDASQAGTLEMTDDTDFVTTFAYYKVGVDVTDDFGNPLAADLTIFNKTFRLEDGHFKSDKTFGEEVPYVVNHDGIVRSGTIAPAVEPDVKVVYDVHSPSISDIKMDMLDARPRLTMTLGDPGTLASGVDVQSAKVVYRLEPADQATPWDNAVLFMSGKDQLTAEFQQLPPDRVVSFRVEIKDKAGNKAEVNGKFTTFVAQPEVNATNATQNQTNTQQNPAQPQGLPLSYIVAGTIITVLAVYLVFRMKSKDKGAT
jgi:hypothetical protein